MLKFHLVRALASFTFVAAVAVDNDDMKKVHSNANRGLRHRRKSIITSTKNDDPLSLSLASSPAGRDVIVKYKSTAGMLEAELRGWGNKQHMQLRHSNSGRNDASGNDNDLQEPKRLNKVDAIAGYFTEDDIAALSIRPDIEYVEDDPIEWPFCDASTSAIAMERSSFVSRSDSYATTMTQSNQVEAAVNANGEPIMTVCIIDTGLDADHEDIQRRNVEGRSFVDRKHGDWHNSQARHGMYIAGNIAALQNRCGVEGVENSGNLRLLVARAFIGIGKGGAKMSTTLEAAEWCADNGANVINMSYGSASQNRARAELMKKLWDDGILLVAAAGNNGDSGAEYPASLKEVVSVGMVDKDENVPAMSQQNRDVELVAPGVALLTTTAMGRGDLSLYVANGSEHEAAPMKYGPNTNELPNGVTGVVVDCGYGDEPCPPASSGASFICLIERGSPNSKTIKFIDKVRACEEGNGAATIIYNNKEVGVMKGSLTKENEATIPAIGITQAQGKELLNAINADPNLTVSMLSQTNANYEYAEAGTSMAAPFVAGISAIIWSWHPDCTNAQIRRVLQSTAKDGGKEGRDQKYGFGIVQAKAALDYLDSYGCDGM